VDDLHAAVWFALNQASTKEPTTYQRSRCEFGWILLISVPREVKRQDLRERQSSRNTRCHVQQGFSLALQYDDAPAHQPDQDFTRYVVGTVRVPNSDNWHLNGFRSSQGYFSPALPGI